MGSTAVLRLTHVNVIREEKSILHEITWEIKRHERWVILGPNGSGKTTLSRLAGLYIHPSQGTIDVLGRRLGQTDVRELRKHLGFTSTAIAKMLDSNLAVSDVVVTGKTAALAPYWHTYTAADRTEARHLLERFRCDRLIDSAFGSLSSGEQQRVLLARTLMANPSLLILDEPTAGLDLGGREDLVTLLARLATESSGPAMMMVTHHVDEIPPGFDNVLLLRKGRLFASGKAEDVLTANRLSECFGLTLHVEKRNDRWSSWAAEQVSTSSFWPQ